MSAQRQKAIYFLHQPYRIGQLVFEIWSMRNLFNDNYDLVIITPPPDQRVNKPVYDFIMRDIRVLHECPGQLNWSTTEGIKNIDGDIYVFLGHGDLLRKLLKNFVDQKFNFYFSLTDEDIKRSNRLRDLFDIPTDAPIVTLHNREVGYLSELAYHSYRDANIENYIPTIEYLVSKGYYVIRLGDKRMKPLPHISDRVIEAPFHPLYSGYVELYFTPLSKFMISVPSGPYDLSRCFDVPVLSVNTPIQSALWGNEHDLILPKKYYSRILKRYLTYGEIIMSELPDFYRTEEYRQFGVELQENSSEEILQATMEMHTRLEGRYDLGENADAINNRIKKIERRGDCFQKHVTRNIPAFNFSSWPLYWSKAQINHEFIKMNSYFLEEKHWEPEIETSTTTVNSVRHNSCYTQLL